MGTGHAVCEWEGARHFAAARAARWRFFGAAALLFVASATATIACCVSMSAMGAQPMPGGWTIPSAWMPMCGQTPLGFAASFLGMWLAMMAAMMLPSLTPALWRYREAIAGVRATRLGALSALAGLGYVSVWSVLGVGVFSIGRALAEVALREPALARAFPLAAGVVVLSAGALQFSAWKARHLAGCRSTPLRERIVPSNARTAWRYGLRLGVHCACSCAGLTAALLVTDVMDLCAMALLTVAITAERLAPDAESVTKVIGALAIGTGLALLARAAGVG